MPRRKMSEDEALETAANALEQSEVSPDDLNAADDAADAAEKAAAQMSAGGTLRDAVAGHAGAVNLTFDQLKDLLGTQRSLSPEQLVEMATKAAMAGADRVKPKELTVTQTERKSAFNPLGERDHPRPRLKCYMYFGSAPIGSRKEVATLTREEIEALNGITPGHYRVRKTDGSSAVIEIKGQYNSNRELDRLWILLPEGDENKNAYPPLAEFARQCSEANRVEPVAA